MAASGRVGDDRCEEIEALTALSRSRTEPASRVSRARCCWPIARSRRSLRWDKDLGVHHQTVQRCVERALAYGALAALDDRPRPGKEPVDHAGGQGLVGVFGVRQGQGAWLSARAVDDAAFGPSCARARTGGGSRMSRPAGPGHGVQDPRPGGHQAAQGALLSGTPRRRVRSRRWRRFCASIARSRS